MNIEILVAVSTAITTGAIMLSGIIATIAPKTAMNKWSFIVKAIYAGILSFAFGYIGGGFTNILGDPQMGMLIGIIVGQIFGYTNLMTRILKFIWKWIVKFVRWIWKIAKWWVKAIIIIVIVAVVAWLFINYIII